MDSSNPWGLSEAYGFTFNDEDFPFWGTELDYSQFLSSNTDLDQMSLQLPEPPFQHISTSLSPDADLGKSSGLISDGYLQPNPTFSPMTAPLPVNNPSSSDGSSSRDKNSVNQSTLLARTSTAIHGCSSGNGTKHNLEDAIHMFPANPNREVTPRKRKAFSPSRKAEVALTRRVGACLQCKKRKETCHFGFPCRHCLTRIGSLELAQEICTRQSLVVTRFDNLELLGVIYYDIRINQLGIRSLTGTPRSVYLGYPPVHDKDLAAAYIKISVVDYVSQFERPTRTLVSYQYDSSQKKTITVNIRPLAIEWESLPSIDALVTSYNLSQDNAASKSGPFSGLQRAVKLFTECYCAMSSNLALKDIVAKCLKLKQMFAIYERTASIRTSLDDRNDEFPCTAIVAQLGRMLAKEIVKTELATMCEIEGLFFASGKIGAKNSIAAWVCLWTLIFVYRDHMIHISAFTFSPYHDDAQRYALTQHIYQTLTSIYAAEYKTSSPLNLDWRRTEVAQMLGFNQELIELFRNIKIEMFAFHAERDNLLQVDNIVKTLVVENEFKILEEYQKTAERESRAKGDLSATT